MWFFEDLSLGHFGQQAPESSVFQLPNGVATYSLPPFIVALLTFKDNPRSNSFSSMRILERFKWKTSQADNNGLKQQLFAMLTNSYFSFWQCQKQMKKMGSEKSAPPCPFDRGGGGSKDIGAMPMKTTHFKKGLPSEYDWLIGEWLDTSVLMHHVLVPSTNSIRIAECRQKETMTIDNWDICQSPNYMLRSHFLRNQRVASCRESRSIISGNDKKNGIN